MKRIMAVLACLALMGIGCPFTTAPPPAVEPPPVAPPISDGLDLMDAAGQPIPDGLVRKQHLIGTSTCPDPFPPMTVDFPPGWEEAAVPPTTTVSWLDLPDTIKSGEPFQMKFNCDISRFDSHAEVAQVKLDFAGYAKQHPGLEHAAGVPKGGTFIVVTETWSGPVVPDFELPYICCSDCASVEYCVLDSGQQPASGDSDSGTSGAETGSDKKE